MGPNLKRNEEKLGKRLRALLWAMVHMEDAIEVAELLLSLPDPSRNLSHGLMTGCVISYARSFGENNGLSKIDPSFGNLPNKKLQILHDALLETRNTIYAHRDTVVEGVNSPATMSADEIRKLEIIVPKNGSSWKWEVARTGLPDDRIEDFIQLFRVQADRFKVSAGDAITALGKGKRYRPGRYTVGVDFP